MTDQQIEVIARGVLFLEDQLLLCRNRKHGHLFLPGGHVEYGEGAMRALQREIEEELSLRTTIGTFLGACEASFDQARQHEKNHHHELNLVFEIIPPAGLRSHDLASKEVHIEFIWAKRSDIESAAILPKGIAALIMGSRANWVSLME